MSEAFGVAQLVYAECLGAFALVSSIASVRLSLGMNVVGLALSHGEHWNRHLDWWSKEVALWYRARLVLLVAALLFLVYVFVSILSAMEIYGELAKFKRMLNSHILEVVSLKLVEVKTKIMLWSKAALLVLLLEFGLQVAFGIRQGKLDCGVDHRVGALVHVYAAAGARPPSDNVAWTGFRTRWVSLLQSSSGDIEDWHSWRTLIEDYKRAYVGQQLP